MDTVPLNEVDIKSLIKLSWSQLGILLNGLKPTESNQVIKVLLKDLEALQSKLIEKHENDVIPKDLDETEREVETIELNLATNVHSKSVDPNYEYNLFQDNEIADEGNLLEDQEDQNISDEQTEIIDNEWYTFVSNEDTAEADSEIQFENNEIKEGEEFQKSMDKESFAQKAAFEHEMNLSGSLKTHERLHTADMTFQCKTCDKIFTKSQNLKVHQRIHLDEKPFGCEDCYKKFRQFAHLQKHKRNVHHNNTK